MRIETAGLRPMIARAILTTLLTLSAGAAMAGTGEPSPWQMNLQGMVTEVGRDVADFHYWLLWLITAISLFVLVLIVAIVIRFGEKRNPVPSRTTHNSLLEVAWTV